MPPSVKLTPIQCEKLYAKAHAAGIAAVEATRPVPMVVQQVGAGGEVLKTYDPIADGVCGFAWVNVRPGNSSFARWLVANTHAHKAYEGGIDLWIREFNQSYTYKLAYAQAFASALRESDVVAYGRGRLD
jgi:hypothetical protein